jgi:HEAT repeat protein
MTEFFNQHHLATSQLLVTGHSLGAAMATDKLPDLVAGLKSEDSDVKAACAQAIGKCGASGAKYEEQLMGLLDDPHPMVVKEACDSLGAVAAATTGNPAAAEKVAECLKCKHPAVRGAALKSLGKMKDEALAYLEDIVKCLDDQVAYIRYCAIEAIAGCGDSGQMFAAKVCRLMYDPQPKVRLAAITALKDMGAPRGAAFAEEVAVLLGDDEPKVRLEAVLALTAFGSDSYAYMSSIQDAADSDPDDDVRAAARSATEQIREPASFRAVKDE